jgi:hypothetical protein
MSASPEPTSNSPRHKPGKSRNPIERLLVWGGILILSVLVGIEYSSSRAQTAAVGALTAKMRTNEQAGTDLKLADVKAAVGGKTPRVENVSEKQLRNGAKRLEVYRWFSINPLKPREMYVYYGLGEDPDVLSVSTDEETETVPPLTELDAEQLKDLKVFEDGLKKLAESNAISETQPDAKETAVPAKGEPAKD